MIEATTADYPQASGFEVNWNGQCLAVKDSNLYWDEIQRFAECFSG